MRTKKDKENKEPSKGKVGRPPFVPTDEDRAVVKLLIACGMSQDRVCLRIRGNDGKPICEATLKRHFAHELMVGKVEVETMVFTQFMAAINRGERWAIYKYMDQQMWRPESGGWRARPYEVAVDGALPAASGGNNLFPLQLIVQFVKPDPSMRPILPR
jgi:hypothetical protein